MDNINSKVTAIIKTFERPDKVVNLHKSLRIFYPEMKVIIVDDSLSPITYEWGENTEYIHTEYDIGLSEGRNLAVSKVATPYTLLLDDDFIFTRKTKIHNLIDVLDHSDFKIVAGQVLDFGKNKLVFKGLMKIEDGILTLNNYKKGRKVDGYQSYDFVLNFFLADTQTLRDYPWDKELKIREHEEFFWRLKIHNILITSINSVSISHFPTSDAIDTGEMYFKKRIERMKFFHDLACQKIGVSDFRSLGARYYGFGILHFVIFVRMVSEKKCEHSWFWNSIFKIFSWKKSCYKFFKTDPKRL